MAVWAIVVAGGRGDRFGAPKQYALLAGRRVLDWSVATARAVCDGVVLVLPADDLSHVTADADVIVAGGDTRSGSVRAGLAALPAAADVVAIHDAARPLAANRLWRATIDAVLAGADGAVPAVAVTDTIKVIGPDGGLRTLEREGLVAVQTPQVFKAEALRHAHAAAADATDDAALVEANGGTVVFVAGDPANVKITAPSDLLIAAALLDKAEESQA